MTTPNPSAPSEQSQPSASGKIQLLDMKNIASVGGVTTGVWITTNLIHFLLAKVNFNFDQAWLAFILAMILSFAFLADLGKGAGIFRKIILGFLNGCIITFSALGFNFTSTSLGSAKETTASLLPFEEPWFFPTEYKEVIIGQDKRIIHQQAEIELKTSENTLLYWGVAKLAFERNIDVKIESQPDTEVGVVKFVTDKIQATIPEVAKQEVGKLDEEIRIQTEMANELERQQALEGLEPGDNVQVARHQIEAKQAEKDRLQNTILEAPPQQELIREINQQQNQLQQQYINEIKREKPSGDKPRQLIKQE